MTLHICRDLVVGSTGSYSNMYAIGCFLQGVLGFTQVGASGRAEWVNNLLPVAIQTGSVARFPGMQMYCSASQGVIEIPINQMDILPDDEVGFVYGLPGAVGSKPEFLDVAQAHNLWTSKPFTSPYLFGATGSTLPAGTPFVTQSGGVYYIGHDNLGSGAIQMNLPVEEIDVDPISSTDFSGHPIWIPDFAFGVGDDPTLFAPWTDYVLAIKSTSFPLVNSGLYRIFSAGPSPGYSVATGSVTGTFKIFFDTRTFDSGSVPFFDTNFSFAVFPPVEVVNNDLDIPFNVDPDADGDVDIAGWDNNPPQGPHFFGPDPPGASGPDFIPLTGGPPNRSYYNDTSLSPSDLDDQPGKASLFFSWTGSGDSGNLGTMVASLLDSPAFNTTPNDGHYHGQGGFNRLRVIYQSPHPTGWQVRLCMESQYDQGGANAGGACAGVSLSIAPGFSGSGGDFATGPQAGRHLHGALWYNTASSSYLGLTVGLNPDRAPVAGNMGNVFAAHNIYSMTSFNAGRIFSPSTTTTDYRWRMYMWGDDVTGTVVICSRGYFNASDEMAMFGLPEDEPVPLQADAINRLFVIGQSDPSQGVDWRTGTQQFDGISGVAYSLKPDFGPISCAFAVPVYAATQGSEFPPGGTSANGGNIRFDDHAGDTPFLGASELMPVDIVAGTRDNVQTNASVQLIPMEPRRMGRTPFARLGRSTGQPLWTTVDPSNTWFHTTNGFYLPWGGVRPLS